MKLVRFRHKGLKQLHEDGNAKGVPPAMADKLRKLPFALETLDQIWSLTVTGNWRLMFRYDEEANSADDIDLLDYH